MYEEYLVLGEEVTGQWKKLHNEELHNELVINTIGVIKSRKMRWVGPAAHMGEMRNAYNFKGVRVWSGFN
jgi:hypothetical protein